MIHWVTVFSTVNQVLQWTQIPSIQVILPLTVFVEVSFNETCELLLKLAIKFLEGTI